MNFDLQSYAQITSDGYLSYISKYVVGIGPWKDTIVPPKNNYLTNPTDLVARAHAHNLQVKFVVGTTTLERESICPKSTIKFAFGLRSSLLLIQTTNQCSSYTW